MAKIIANATPFGFYDNIYQEDNKSRQPEIDFCSFWYSQTLNKRYHGIRKNGNLKCKNRHVLSLSVLSINLKWSGSNVALSRLVTLSISSQLVYRG